MSERGSRPTESPWLWVAIFAGGAIVSLLLATPKYQWRQPQLERQFLARQRGGQTVARREQPSGELGRPMISLRPLILGLTGVILLLSCLFWLGKWFRRANEP